MILQLRVTLLPGVRLGCTLYALLNIYIYIYIYIYLYLIYICIYLDMYVYGIKGKHKNFLV